MEMGPERGGPAVFWGLGIALISTIPPIPFQVGAESWAVPEGGKVWAVPEGGKTWDVPDRGDLRA